MPLKETTSWMVYRGYSISHSLPSTSKSFRAAQRTDSDRVVGSLAVYSTTAMQANPRYLGGGSLGRPFVSYYRCAGFQ